KDLKNPGSDAREFAAKLVETYKFERENVRLLVSDETSDDAYKAAILAQWKNAIDKLEPGDIVIFYFAGHGIELKGRFYMLPSDAQPFVQEQKAGTITFSSIDLQDLIYQLAQKQAEHEGQGRTAGVFILDACRENPYIYDNDKLDERPVGLEAGGQH